MAITRGGDSEYQSGEPTFEEKKDKLSAEIRQQLAKDPEALTFVGRYFSTDEVTILAGCPEVVTVRKLDLKDNQIGDPGLQQLFAAAHLKDLVELDLSINFVTAEGLVELAQSDAVQVSNLRALSLEDNRLKDPGGAAIAGSGNFARLEWLNLSWNEIGLETARALGQGAILENLRFLNLERNYIDEESVAALFSGQGLSRLEALNLASNKLGDEGTAALAEAQTPATLKTLWLSNNSIDDAGAAALGASTRLSALESLYIGRNYFKEDGAKLLYERQAFPHLKNLVLREGMGEEAGFVNYSRPELLRPDAEEE